MNHKHYILSEFLSIVLSDVILVALLFFAKLLNILTVNFRDFAIYTGIIVLASLLTLLVRWVVLSNGHKKERRRR